MMKTTFPFPYLTPKTLTCGKPVFLAPMAGITDMAFRILMREMLADIVVTELVSAEGLLRDSERTWELARTSERETPVGIQIFGSSPEVLARAAQKIELAGAHFVDLNLGCPVKKVVCQGAGADWLRRPSELEAMLARVVQAVRIPVSIKIRLGWDEQSQNALEIVNRAARAGVAWVAIHGRTRAQGYAGAANWNALAEIAAESPLPIIGNGDILTADQAHKRLDACQGIMIGRGALRNPWIFQEIRSHAPQTKNLLEVIRRHAQLAHAVFPPTLACLKLKKFMSWYATGWPHVSHLRRKLFAASQWEECWTIMETYCLEAVEKDWALETTPFLLGGHG